MSEINEGRSQIKRKYGEYSTIRVNEKAPIRNKIINFVGKRFVTEDELKSHLTKVTEEIGKEFDQRTWFKNNQKYFESFENRGQKVWTLSKYGKRVHEFINKPKENHLMENRIGLFKTELFESAFDRELKELVNEGALASKGMKELDTVDVLIDEIDEKRIQDLYEEICGVLGAKPNATSRVDSESSEDDPISDKIYKELQKKFSGAPLTLKKYKPEAGEDIRFDKNLGVIMHDEYGFTCYYFTAKSKF